jgi:hypothetical protein
MVLVGMYYEGKEPNVYPDCLHDEDDWYCQCAQSVANSIDTTVRQNQKDITFLDTAFLQYKDKPEWSYRGWRHVKEVYKHYLWKMFVFLYKS